MKRILTIYVLLFISLTSACSNSVTSEKNNPAAEPKDLQETKADNTQNQDLQNQIEQMAGAAKGRVGATATVLETGESVSLNGSGQFPMQSVYKLPIAMAVLKEVDAGKIKLDQKVPVKKSDFVRVGQRSPIRDKYPNGAELSVNELLQFSISESDGTASDVLLNFVGGAEAVMNFLGELGISEMIVANTEKEFGIDRALQYKNWASPNGAVALLRALHERRGLSEQSQALLLKFMIESPTGPKRLKGLLPKGAIVAHKTGTSGAFKGVTTATNDIRIITLPNGRHLAVAVFVMESPADEKTREEVIAKIAKAAWDKWSR
jgi:beta-lactamase class A